MLGKVKSWVRRYPNIARFCAVVRDAVAFRMARPRMTPLGFALMGNPLMQAGVFEPQESSLVLDLLRRSEVFVDVGANIGFYTCLAKQRGKAVVAIEPLRRNLDYLFANLEVNGWRDVEVYPVGLAAEPGLAVLYGLGTGASLVKGWAGAIPGLRRTIPLSTLDILLGERFPSSRLLIKVDVEGTEYELLQGALRTLDRTPAPVWMVEIGFDEHHPTGINSMFEETFRIFWNRGYHSWTADREFRPVTLREVECWVAKRKRDFGRENYIFSRDESCLAPAATARQCR